MIDETLHHRGELGETLPPDVELQQVLGGFTVGRRRSQRLLEKSDGALFVRQRPLGQRGGALVDGGSRRGLTEALGANLGQPFERRALVVRIGSMRHVMLEHLGEKDAAGRLMKAIERVTADKRFHTPDLGGKARTADVTAAVVDAIQGANS